MAEPYNPATAYPPPGNSNGGYPPPGSPNGSYQPPSSSNGGYQTPSNPNGGGYPPPGNFNSGGYPPPSTNSNGGGYPPPSNVGGYPPPGTNYPPPDTTNPNALLGYPPPSGAGTGYPYFAPPPPPLQPGYNPHQQHYYPAQGRFSNNTKLRACYRRFCIILIILSIVIGLIILIFWILYRPHLPVFRVDNLTVKDFIINGTALSATFDLALMAINPNSKMKVSYDKPQIALFFKHASLADTLILDFEQDKKNEMQVKASLTAMNKELDSNIVDEMKYDKEKTGRVEFDVKMLAKIGFDAGLWKTDEKKLKILCAELPVSLSSNSATGSLAEGPKTCDAGF